MAQLIDPLRMRLDALISEDTIAELPKGSNVLSPKVSSEDLFVSKSPFEVMLSSAISALENVSKTEVQANKLMDQYVHGEADINEAMVAASKMGIEIQMAATVVNLAVNTIKEITQMQI